MQTPGDGRSFIFGNDTSFVEHMADGNGQKGQGKGYIALNHAECKKGIQHEYFHKMARDLFAPFCSWFATSTQDLLSHPHARSGQWSVSGDQ